MDETETIISRYDETYIGDSLRSLDDINRFTGNFVKDVAEIYDCITRMHNIEHNPTGFDLEGAPILGLLTSIRNGAFAKPSRKVIFR